METSKIFLEKVKKKIEDGVYNDYFTLPFMSKKKLYSAIKLKIQNKLEKGATPILSDVEIIDMIGEMKEASGSAFHLFLNYGFLEQGESGYQITEKGKLAIKESMKMK